MAPAALLIFAGPTLAGARLPRLADALVLPPAAHGDVYRATLRVPPPRAILLVDGYFRSHPAVRHKEILWALTRGIHVFGTASIGALRAAELAAFGMVGIGVVFEAFHTGALTDDDEVAVEHGPAELGYPPVSEAMVDIRATLTAASREGVIGGRTESLLVEAAKATFYARRGYTALLAEAEPAIDAAELDALRRWLPQGRVQQKQADAQAALAQVAAFLATDPGPFRPAFRFAHTEGWEADAAHARAQLEAG